MTSLLNLCSFSVDTQLPSPHSTCTFCHNTLQQGTPQCLPLVLIARLAPGYSCQHYPIPNPPS